MTWNELLEHQEILAGFRRAIERGRLASTFLFVGPAGIGKRTFATKLAQALFCETHSDTELEACGHCPSCAQVAAGTHPDLEYVCKPADKAYIPLETFIGDKEHRNREGLCHRIALKPMRGRRKIAIIDDADHLNAEGANCLLKTLEEPPAKSLIILIGTSAQRQLPTIRSRCQIIRFGPLSPESVETLLLRHGLIESPEEAQSLAAMSDGSLQGALSIRDESMREFRDQFLRGLPHVANESVQMAKELMQFVEAAGKDAPQKRARLRTVAGWAMEHYRSSMRAAAVEGNQSYQAEREASRLERSALMIRHVDSNANLTSVVEAWIDDLARA